MKLIALLSLVTLISLSGCKTKKNFQSPEEVKEDINGSVDDMLSELDDEIIELDENSQPTERPKYNPSEKRVNDLIHTKLSVAFDWKQHYLNGSATLDFKPYFYPVDSLILDAKGMEIKRVALVIGKEKYTDLTYKYDSAFIRIKLDKTYTREDQYTVYVEYVAKPDAYKMGGSSAISGDKGLYFINADSSEQGKPTQIWTQGETEASSRWFPTIDAPNEKTTQEIDITVQSHFKTLSNGVLEFSTDNGDGTRTDYWKQSLQHAPYLFMMAVGDFSIVKDSWTRKNGKKMAVNYYVEEAYEPYAKDIFGETPKMIEYFSTLLGVEYPWDKYSQVVVRDFVSGAMENTTATIHGDFLYRTKRELIDEHNESIIAHELFHHWFGDLVTCESWANLPLNESFANYSQYLWDEHKYGLDEAAYHAYSERETYIAMNGRAAGPVNMIRFGYTNKEDMFDVNSYNKGGRILHMLRTYIGDEAFFMSLNKYLTEHKFKTTEIEHLRLAFESTTGEDLHWFFDQWFLAKGHPTLEVETKVDSVNKTVTIYTKQTQDTKEFPVYKLPIVVDLYSSNLSQSNSTKKNGSAQRKIYWLNRTADTITYNYNGDHFKMVNFDASRTLLAEINFEKTQRQYIYQYYNAPLYLDRKEALIKVKSSSSAEAVQLVIDAMSDPFWHVREMAVQNLRKAARKQPNAVKLKLIDLIKTDPKSSVRAAALGALNKHYRDSENLTEVYELASKDQSYYVMSIAIQSLADENLDKAYLLAKSLENEKSSSILTTVGDIYAKKGRSEDNAFYMKNWTSINGFERISFLKTYTKYLKTQDNKTILDGLSVFEEVAAKGGSMWEKYFSGYQILIDFRSQFNREQNSISNEIKTLEANGASSSELNLKERELQEAKRMYNTINDRLQELKKVETNQEVLEFIDSGASMEFIDEE